MGLVAIAMMAGATGTTTARVTGIGIGTAIVEAAGTAADSIAPTPRALRRLTGAKLVGLCKTVSANRTGATDTQVCRVALSYLRNVVSAGVNEFIIPNYKQTWAGIRKIADAPEAVRGLTFKSEEYSRG